MLQAGRGQRMRMCSGAWRCGVADTAKPRGVARRRPHVTNGCKSKGAVAGRGGCVWLPATSEHLRRKAT